MYRSLLLTAFFLFADLASASDVIELKIKAFGVEGAYRQQQGVALLRVQARNTSGQARIVTIRAYQADLSSFASPAGYTYVQSENLAPGVSKDVDIPLRLGNAPNSVLYAEALDEAGMPLGHAAQILGRASDGKMIGLVCATDELCKTIREKILFSGTAEEQTRKSQDLRLIQLRQIPPHWWAFSPLDTIVLAAPTKAFTTEELDGLEAFALGGGRLVLAEKEIGASADAWPSFAGTKGPDSKTTLAPFGRGTLVKIGSVDGTEFSNFFRPYGFATSTPTELVTQFQQYRMPLLSQPQASLVTWLHERTATHFRFPGPLKLILWMASYLILMIIVSFLLPRKFGRPEIAWLTIPALAVLFATVLYKVSAQNRPVEYKVEESRYYQMDGDSTLAIAASEVQVSSPRKGIVRLNLPGEFLYEPPNAYGIDKGWPLTEIALGETWKTDIFLRVWSSKNLSFGFIHRFPGTVKQTDNTHVMNTTGVNFEDAIVVTKDRLYILGPLPAGTTADLRAAKQIPYAEASGHTGNLLRTPPFEFGQSKPTEADLEEPSVKWTDTSGGSASLTDIVLGWPKDGERVFYQTKAVFFGTASEVVRPARLENVQAQQKSTALYCVTYRNWK